MFHYRSVNIFCPFRFTYSLRIVWDSYLVIRESLVLQRQLYKLQIGALVNGLVTEYYVYYNSL